jgi:hypothetical protein
MKTETMCRPTPCDSSVTERPRYFPGQLITPDDLIQEQEYFRNKLKRHNRLLHGWGVVCGALVCLLIKEDDAGDKQAEQQRNTDTASDKEYEPWKVVVRPGYILGPYGDEIYIECSRVVDIRTSGKTDATGEPCLEVPDPWCTDPMDDKPPGEIYVAVRYKEILTRPVRVQPVGCGCDETQCEYSRWRDGYEIRILNHCPPSHDQPPQWEDLNTGPVPQCPPCPDDAWVVLAKVTFEADGRITRIDNCDCRRMVHALGHFWWSCTEPDHDKDDPTQKGGPTTKKPVRKRSGGSGSE